MPELPPDQQSPPAEVQPAPKQIINNNNRGQIYLNGKPVTMDELKAELAAQARAAQKPTSDEMKRSQDKK